MAQAPFCGTPSPSFCQVQVVLLRYPNRSTGLPRRRVASVAWTGPRIRYQRSGSPGRGRETRVRSHTFLAIHGALIHPHHQPHPHHQHPYHHVAPVRTCSVSVDDEALLVSLFPPPPLPPTPDPRRLHHRHGQNALLFFAARRFFLRGSFRIGSCPRGSVESGQQEKDKKKKKTKQGDLYTHKKKKGAPRKNNMKSALFYPKKQQRNLYTKPRKQGGGRGGSGAEGGDTFSRDTGRTSTP